MTAVGHLAVIVTTLLIASGAAHVRNATTNAWFSDTEDAIATYTADVPVAACAVFWADSQEKSALKITGSDHEFFGCTHSNGGYDLAGARDDFHRTIRHGGVYNNNSNGHIVRAGVVQIQPSTFPYPYTVSDYAPTGCKARQAANSGAYYSYIGSNVQIKGPLVRPGLHYVQGSTVVDLSTFTGNITIVATDKVNGASGILGARPYVDQLMAHAGGSGPNTLTWTGNGGSIRGSIYAPYGEVSFTAQNNTYTGQVMGWRVTVSGSESDFYPSAPVGYRPCL